LAKRILTNEYTYILISGLVLLLLIQASEGGLPVWLQIIRAILGLGFVLFIPGYCLQAFAFPSRSEVDGKERLAISFGLSLAGIPALAMVLDYLPWRITLWSVSFGIFCIIFLFSILGLIRRSRLPEAERYLPLEGLQPADGWRSLQPGYRIVYILIAVVLVIVSSTAISIITSIKPAQRMTEFYLLTSEGQAENYPRETQIGQAINVKVGISNLEGEPARYRVEILDGLGLVGQAGPVSLEDGATRELPVSFSLVQSGDYVEVTFLLFRDQHSEPYRTLHLILSVKPKS